MLSTFNLLSLQMLYVNATHLGKSFFFVLVLCSISWLTSIKLAISWPGLGTFSIKFTCSIILWLQSSIVTIRMMGILSYIISSSLWILSPCIGFPSIPCLLTFFPRQTLRAYKYCVERTSTILCHTKLSIYHFSSWSFYYYQTITSTGKQSYSSWTESDSYEIILWNDYDRLSHKLST